MTAQEEGPHVRPQRLPSDLAELRTVMAADRTLMAWVRTSLAMLSFGFTIYKFLEGVAADKGDLFGHSPQDVGLFLAAIGTLSILMGTIEYWTTLKDLYRAEKFRLGRPAFFIAVIMSVSGVVLFVSIALRLL